MPPGLHPFPSLSQGIDTLAVVFGPMGIGDVSVSFSDDPADLFTALADLVERRPSWMRDAACKEHGELSWFVARGESCVEQKAICGACLVRPECLAFSLVRPEHHGLWGGLSERERRRYNKAVSITGREAA